MIVDERITSYIHSLDQGNTQLLTQIEREARADLVPIIRQETASFLKVLLRMQRPKNILEVGTAVGFSALFMSEYAPADCRVTTIENMRSAFPCPGKFPPGGKRGRDHPAGGGCHGDSA